MAQSRIQALALQRKIISVEGSIDAKYLVLQTLCGAFLQVVKQGISLICGSKESCPDGRLIGEIPMKDIIWSARYQVLHFEDT